VTEIPDRQEVDITVLLRASREGDGDALDRLIEAICPSLCAMARGQISKERSGHTLDATALAHETLIRLFLRNSIPEAKDRHHLLATAAQQMRRILIDHARARLTARRDAAGAPAPGPAPHDLEQVLLLDRLLDELGRHDPRAARTVELRFFAGLSAEEIAAETGTTRRTVQRDWEFARAWLHAALVQDDAV
jgi:RNA polymerase sigma-70 factor, ECF subfamily